MIAVVSTGLNSPNKQRCLESVKRQVCPVPLVHLYVEAANQVPPLPAMQNLWETVMRLPKATIVAHLDGDDELDLEDALAIVARAYEDPLVWMTYGSQRVIDINHRQEDHRKMLLDDVPEREQDCPSHLKTYYAGLFQAAHHDPTIELQRLVSRAPVTRVWRDYYRCGAELYPMLELCGPTHRRYIPDVLVNYRYDLSENKRMTKEENEQEQIELREVKALPRRARVGGLEL